MSTIVEDPVSRVRMSFERQGEDLLVDLWLLPGGKLPSHRHPRQEEYWSVVSGSARVDLGGEWRTVTPADGELPVPPETRHGIASAEDAEAHLRCRVVPALRLQEFLEESAAAGREGMFTQSGLPRGLRGARWAARFLKKYRDETVFLSPPPALQKVLIALLARD